MKPSVGRAIFGGLFGTVLITFMMYFMAPMMVGKPMDIAALLGKMLGDNWTMGMVMHFVNGTFIFPLIYALALYPALAGKPWVRGALWGLTLWFLSQALVMPMMGGGFFSSRMGGMMAAIGSLMGHVVYGAVLGGNTGGQVSNVPETGLPLAA